MTLRLNAVLSLAITVGGGAVACSGGDPEGSTAAGSASGATSSNGSTPSSSTSSTSAGNATSGTPTASTSAGTTAGMSASSTGVGGANGSSSSTDGTTGAGGDGTSAGSTGGPIVGMISDLTIEPNPNSVLSAYVSWTTAEPSTSVVQFGKDALTWEIEGESGVTEHRVLVIGMHASSLYQIRAVSSGASGTVEGTGTFMTDALPSQIPVGNITVNDASRAQPGLSTGAASSPAMR